MSIIESLNSIDKSKIKWIKNVKRDKGLELAYFDEYENNEFNLHWPKSKAGNASALKQGEYIILYQNYLNKGVLITHLVEVIDDYSFIDDVNAPNFQTARRVRIIYRTENIRNDKRFKFDFRNVSQGQAFRLNLLNESLTIDIIRFTFIELFKSEELSKFRISSTENNEFVFQIPRNKLYQSAQQIKSKTKTLTFVGKNGCGKSAILESIFSASINDNVYKYICFSSGQNELFSKIFGRIQYLNRNKYLDKEELDVSIYDSKISAFFFNTRWVRILIFFAFTFKPNGRTSNLIKLKFATNDETTLDIKLGLDFKIDWDALAKVKQERAREERGFLSGYIQSSFFRTIESYVNHCIDPNYEFIEPIKQTSIELTPQKAQTIYPERDVDKALNSFVYGEKYFDISKSKLQINDLELRDLSDGEFQLLTVYALIDLFDSDETVFLLDEIDSHLYYDNIIKVWETLSSLNGFVFTSTHIADSIVKSDIDNIRLVENGQIKYEFTLDSIIKRLDELSNSRDFQYILSAKIENIVLIDNINDWIAFIQLVKIKCPEFDIEKLNKLKVISVSSGAVDLNQTFGDSKIKWLEKLITQKNLKTKNVFMICDKDIFPIQFCPNGVQVTGENKKKQFGNNGNAYLLAWKRKQIENYLISHSLMTKIGIIGDIEDLLPRNTHILQDNNHDDNSHVRELEMKDLVKNIYCDDKGLNTEKREELINQIPALEISDDILNMYNFIVSKIN